LQEAIKKETMKFEKSSEEDDLELFIGLYEDKSFWLSMDTNNWDSGASIEISREELIKIKDMINRILE